MLRIINIKLDVTEKDELQILKNKISKILKISESAFKNFEISKKSIDAREKNLVKYVYSIDVDIENENKYLHIKNVSVVSKNIYIINNIKNPMTYPPVIIGSGPAGLFAGLVLAESGCCPIILERGKDVDSRKKDIDTFWQKSILNENSNVQFGEGGAGTFSDGKLTTGTNDMRICKVIDELIESGAPPEIKHLSKPHIGTDRLLTTVKNIRKKIINLGGTFHFESKFLDFHTENDTVTSIRYENKGKIQILETNQLILAIGHSARDTLEMLYKKGVEISAKPFAVGVRIEHSQKMISRSQYGEFAKNLPAADYKLNVHLANGRGVYTFCMCPGGQVVGASSEKNMVATNGMSHYSRNLENANSALLISVNPNDFPSAHPLAGMEFQRNLERKAFEIGGCNYFAPVQTVGDFLKDKETISFKDVLPTYKPGVTPCDLRDCLPSFIIDGLKDGILLMNNKLKGFSHEGAILTGVETRSSSPVTIKRNSDLQSNFKGLFPCGEGAGHAGGIMSAAVDGIKCAEKLLENFT